MPTANEKIAPLWDYFKRRREQSRMVERESLFGGGAWGPPGSGEGAALSNGPLRKPWKEAVSRYPSGYPHSCRQWYSASRRRRRPGDRTRVHRSNEVQDGLALLGRWKVGLFSAFRRKKMHFYLSDMLIRPRHLLTWLNLNPYWLFAMKSPKYEICISFKGWKNVILSSM